MNAYHKYHKNHKKKHDSNIEIPLHVSEPISFFMILRLILNTTKLLNCKLISNTRLTGVDKSKQLQWSKSSFTSTIVYDY